MNSKTKLAFRPGMTFNPDDLIQVEGGALQFRPGSGPAQAALDLRPPEPKGPPWANESTELTTILNFRHTHQLHAKMEWIIKNVAGYRSLHALMDAAITAHVSDLIAKHYKPES